MFLREALSGRTGEVVYLEAPEWPPSPADRPHPQRMNRSRHERATLISGIVVL